MKLGYLIYNERPNSGLMNTQVLELLKEISKNNSVEITLVAIWQPWVYIKYFNKIKKLKKDLLPYNIILKSLPYALPSRYFFTNKFLLDINIFYIYVVLKLFNLNNFDIIHCRGYFISYIAAALKKDFKLIFDMRSLFPEENISSGKWKQDSVIYKKWKQIEKVTIDKSEKTIGVSLPMVEILTREYMSDAVVYVPIGFNEKKIVKNESQREELREKLNIREKIVIVYSGSLELGFWNDIRVYCHYFKNINRTIENVHFLILTNSNHTIITEKLAENQIENYTLLSVDSNDVAKYLNAADIGIQVMDELPDSRTRFGVKTIEYWSIGLPIITNTNVGGINKLIEENKYLGIILDVEQDFEQVKLLSDSKIYCGASIRKYVEDNFTLKHIAKKYIELYEGL